MSCVDIEDLGWMDIKVRPAEKEGEPLCIRLDVWKVNNRIYDLAQKHPNDPLAYNQAIKEMLIQEGFPEGSDYLYGQVVRAIQERVQALGNSESGEQRHGSPDSTASTPSS